MRFRLLACLAFAGVILAGASAAAAESADAGFKALYTKEWTWRETELAHADEGDAVPIQPYLPRVDAASQERRLAYWQDVRRQLDAIPESSLSPEQVVNYQVYRDQIDTLISQQKYREYEKPFN